MLLDPRTPLSLSALACAVALAGCTDVLDASPDGELVALSAKTPAPETDEVPSAEVAFASRDGALDSFGPARAALLHPRGGALLVDDEARLSWVRKGVRQPLLDEVVGKPALLDDGRVVAARSTDPGESDLWLVTLDGAPPRALTATAGADGQPFVLADGRVLFVSDRSGVVALFVVDPSTREVTQLTNQGERPGALSERFVPTPVGEPWQEGARVFYDAGDAIWSVDVTTGDAEEVRR